MAETFGEIRAHPQKTPPPPEDLRVLRGFAKYSRFDPQIFRALYEKCRRKTKFGAIANALLFFLFRLVMRLKRGRMRGQEFNRQMKGQISRLQRKQPLELPLTVRKVAPWHLPLQLADSWTYVQKRITIVAELSIPQCKRYRVDQKLAAFRELGYVAEAVSFTDLDGCLQVLPFSCLVVFYRTPLWPPVQALLDECRRLALPVLFDVDDLVFDTEEYAKHSIMKTLSPADASGLLTGAKLYQDCLAACDYAIASTPTLAVWMRKYCRGQVFVVENGLDDLSLAARARHSGPTATLSIGYGSGTKSHDADFAVAEAALVRLLDARPHVCLALHGYLLLPQSLERFGARIFRIPFLAAPQYLQALSEFDINIAPLETSVFNDAKSNIKYIEASIAGVPTVASGAAAFRQVIRDGVNGFLATTEDEWYQALERLVDFASLRQEIAKRAREDVLDVYGPARTRDSLAAVLAQVLRPRPLAVRPRVLLVNCLYNPSSFGGATHVVEHLATHLASRWDVAVCASNVLPAVGDYRAVRYDVDGTHVFSLRMNDLMLDSAGYSDPEMAKPFRQVLDAFRPDVVHFHSIQGFGADIVTQARSFGAKTVVTHHDAWWVCERHFQIMPNQASCFQHTIDLKVCASCTRHPDFTYQRFRYLTDVLSKVDLNLAPSAYHRQFIQDNLASGMEVRSNSNGVQLPAATPAPRNIDPLNVRIAFIGGGAVSHKGYFVLKSIMEALTETNYTLILTDIHRRIGVPGIHESSWQIGGRLQVVAPFAQADIDRFFEGVDVLVFPSQLNESFGMSVREALLRNVWVIATRSGGVVEGLEDGKNGDLVAIGDTAALAGKIRAVLAHPEVLSGYVTPNRHLVRGFAEQAAELGAFYEELLDAGTGV